MFMSGSTIVIPAEESSINISVQIVDDSRVEERQEMFLVTLTSTLPRVAIGNDDTTEISIIDDDGLFLLNYVHVLHMTSCSLDKPEHD